VLKVLKVPTVLEVLVLKVLVLKVLVLGVLGVLGLGVRGAWAQQPPAAPYVGRTVASIAITIEGRPSTDPSLLTAVQMKTQQPLNVADVRETMTHLYTLGRFEDVQVEAENAANGGVAITIRLEPVHLVTKVEFRGELGLSEGSCATGWRCGSDRRRPWRRPLTWRPSSHSSTRTAAI
jgi:hypothetical protein